LVDFNPLFLLKNSHFYSLIPVRYLDHSSFSLFDKNGISIKCLFSQLFGLFLIPGSCSIRGFLGKPASYGGRSEAANL
jgi:hypothetical protein